MKAVLILLLTGVLLIQPSSACSSPAKPEKDFESYYSGGSLWCYTCRIQLKTDNCKKAVFCKEKAKVCKTDVISLMGLLHIISKQCASSCTTYHKDIAILKRNISCCSTDLCNVGDISASPSNRAHMAMVAFTSLVCVVLSRIL